MTQSSLEQAHGHHQAGRLEEAQKAYREILAREPNHAEAIHLLGFATFQRGDAAEAERLIRRAIELNPNQPIYHLNLGIVVQARGSIDESIDEFRRTLALRPGLAEAVFNLGNAFQLKGQLETALAEYEKAISLRPDWFEAIVNLAGVFQRLERYEPALAAFERADKIRPNRPEILFNIGDCQRNLGRLEESVRTFDRAIELRPDYAEAHQNVTAALLRLGRIDEAISHLRQILRIHPEHAMSHYTLARTLLRRGEFEEGWKHYEYRWKVEEFGMKPRHFTQPQWDGGDLRGRRILLHCEQGFGDAIQFARYAVEVARRGGRVILETPGILMRLFRKLGGVDEFVPVGGNLPDFDVHCPIMSLPMVFGTTLATVPASVPYLWFDPALAEEWRRRITFEPRQLKVGLVWAGRPAHRQDSDRSMSLKQLAPLAAVAGVWLCSLQKGDPAAQTAGFKDFQIVDWTDDLRDFADTAALIANLDLVICVDTAVAHLAGALAKPVWLMIAHRGEWRWMMEKTTSPWYPSMRIFRQTSAGDWAGLVETVAAELQSMKEQSIVR